MFSQTNTQTSTLVDAISFFLREPRKSARHLLNANVAFLQGVETRRNSLQSEARLISIGDSFSFPQQEDYVALQHADQRSRIIASYHFGEFVYGLNYLMSLECSGCNRHFFSQESASPNYFANMHRLFGKRAVDQSAQHVPGPSSALKLATLLRSSRCNLVMFCDLPETYGSRTEAPFMGRRAWFPKGPAALAVLNKVPVLPVIITSLGDRNELHLGQQLEPCLFPGETASVAIERISRQLASYFQCFFQKLPEQWRYLQFLPSYFTESQ